MPNDQASEELVAGEFPECNCLWCSPPDWDLAPPGGVGAVKAGLTDLPAHNHKILLRTQTWE